MIPLRDNNPTRSFPAVTIALILVNIAVFYLQNVGGPEMNAVFNGTYSFIPYELTHNVDLVGVITQTRDGGLTFHAGQPSVDDPLSRAAMPLGPSPHPLFLTIFTSMFMHGSLMHIIGNMLFLWIFGNNVEDALGKVRFLLFYLACGFAAAIVQTVSGPNTFIPNMGASGAIAGVMGAYIVMWPEARVLTLISLGFFFLLREVRAFWVLGIWIVLQLLTSHLQQGGEATGGVAYFAHIGGFAAGLIGIVMLGGRELGRKQRRFATRRWEA
ncbi:MAG TPA: rhomboid family intramembrane serine protease [Capsulimonadaceae bacterium]|jgi:membrane associated rhomboid family serine protease